MKTGARNRLTEVKNGAQQAAVWLLGIIWLAVVFAGMAIAFSPSPHRPILGWALLAVAAVVLLLTMGRWVRVFPALLAYGVLRGMLTILDGHLPNRPDMHSARTEATVMTVLLALAALVSVTFGNRKLLLIDRGALLTCVFCFFWQVADKRRMILAPSIGTLALVAAWAVEHIRLRRRRTGYQEVDTS